jgi:hypothetical protein
MEGGYEYNSDSGTSRGSATSTTDRVDSAIRDTAQLYLDRAGVRLNLQQIESSICTRPLSFVAIAAGRVSSSAAEWQLLPDWRCSGCSDKNSLARV